MEAIIHYMLIITFECLSVAFQLLGSDSVINY